MKADQYILQGFNLRTQIHIFHLQTKSYAEHKALDTFYNEIVELMDEFAETYQGRYSRVKLTGTFKPDNYTKGASVKHLTAFVKASDAMKKALGEKPSDLQNILDEIIGLTNKTLYLLTLS